MQQISTIKIDLAVQERIENVPHALQKLSESEKAIIRATQAKRIKDYNAELFIDVVTDLVEKTHRRLGYTKIDSGAIGEQVELIAQDLIRKYKNLTFEEVKIAIDTALDGEYAKEVFFAPAYLMQWIGKYLDKKAEASKKYANNLHNEKVYKPIPTEEETNKLLEQALQFHFQQMSIDNSGDYEKTIIDFGGVLYGYLEKQKKALTPDRKRQIYAEYLERFPKKTKEQIVELCKKQALIEMIRLAYNQELNNK